MVDGSDHSSKKKTFSRSDSLGKVDVDVQHTMIYRYLHTRLCCIQRHCVSFVSTYIQNVIIGHIIYGIMFYTSSYFIQYQNGLVGTLVTDNQESTHSIPSPD